MDSRSSNMDYENIVPTKMILDVVETEDQNGVKENKQDNKRIVKGELGKGKNVPPPPASNRSKASLCHTETSKEPI